MIRTAFILLAASALLSACDKFPHPMGQVSSQAARQDTPTVAVLDIGAVAKALGRDEVFKEQVQAAGRQLQQQLTDITTGLQGKLREEQAKIGDDPTDEQRKELRQMAANAQRQVQQSQVLARQKALQYQTQLATRFRAEVQPVAAEVARGKGANTVLLSNALLWFEPAVDITGEVIDAMRARDAASGGPAPAPAGDAAPAPAEAPAKTQ